MKEIWLMRHAKSDWSNPELTDFDRPLNRRGKRDAPRMGDWIRSYGQLPELIISSPATRAKATTEAVAHAIGAETSVQWWDELYPGDVETSIERMSSLPWDMERIMIVGHNPHQEELASFLSSKGQLRLRLPTASIAILTSEIENWKEISQSGFYLRALVTPKLLKP
jgi:phosphohistidine phosphatase